jgi:hypothetical protein
MKVSIRGSRVLITFLAKYWIRSGSSVLEMKSHLAPKNGYYLVVMRYVIN